MIDRVYKLLNRYGKISKKEVEVIMNSSRLVELEAGEALYKPGDSSDIYAIQLNGISKIYFISESGSEKISDFCREGDLLNTYNDGTPSESWIVASTPSTFLTIPREFFDNFAYNKITWQMLLSKAFWLCLLGKNRREADFLSLDAKGRYKKFLKQNRDIAYLIPDMDIASYLGITPVSLSRIKSSLNK